jgi:predicted GIY-YIG superfamily endonuclease
MSFWVYMLHWADDSYYTGHTDDIEKRLVGHCEEFYPEAISCFATGTHQSFPETTGMCRITGCIRK